MDQASNPQHSGPAEPLFRAADGPVLPLSFSLGMDRGHAHDGGVRRRRMAARTARTIGPVTATSAIRVELADLRDVRFEDLFEAVGSGVVATVGCGVIYPVKATHYRGSPQAQESGR